jgi:hypothetical protein
MTAHTTEFERTFAVGEPADLRLENIRGSVDIEPGEPGTIAIRAVRRDSTGSAERTRVELTQDAEGRVHAVTRFDSGRLQRPCKVDYTVRVPRNTNLSLSLVASPAAVQGLHGRLRLRTVAGNLLLRQLSGRLSISSVSARVVAEDLSPEAVLDLSTVSGNLRLTAVGIPAVNASTVSGELSLAAPLGAGPHRFKSVSGNVRARLPAGGGCNLRINSLTGRLHTALPVRHQSIRAGRLAASLGRAGADGPEISLSSVSGGLWLLAGDEAGRAEPAAGFEAPELPAPPDWPEPPARPSAEQRRAILDGIARGQTSVEAALEQLMP